MTNLSAELERLYGFGFAVHLLKNRSKVPLHSGWTTGPRQPIEAVKKQYRKGLNIGVRLGKVSEVAGASLAVIDLDIKSSQPAHQAEAIATLSKLFPEALEAPKVRSGRGNKSGHYYVRLAGDAGTELKAQSKDIVKVKMPSVGANKLEAEKLSFEEIESGIRLRPAWEVSLLHEGRQTVLPGSIHPDTGAAYEWIKNVKSPKSIPLVAKVPEGIKKAAEGQRPAAESKWKPRDFKLRDVSEKELRGLGIRKDYIEAIITGEGVDNRSNMVYSVILSMLSSGVDNDTIVSVMTDKKFFLGKVAFEHKKTKHRGKAAQWIDRYSLAKAEAKVFDTDFDIEESSEDELEEEKKARRRERKRELYQMEIEGIPKRMIRPYGFPEIPEAWCFLVDMKKPKSPELPPVVDPTLNTLWEMFRGLWKTDSGGLYLSYDTFSQRITYTVDTPWGAKKGDERSSGNEDALLIARWLQENFEINAPDQRIDKILDTAALRNKRNSLTDYLKSITWDGIPRIAEAFKFYLGAKMPEPYLSEVSTKFFVGCVARAFNPGCPMQHMVVLEGKQGIGKSTFGAILASKPWFIDRLPDLHDKDAAMNLQGAWICEIGELATLGRSNAETAKAFISSDTDRIRPPYGKKRVDFKRTTVFLGTTNEREYLNDPTGNRRYWPVHCEQLLFEQLALDRDQLWAEAVAVYKLGLELPYLEGMAKHQAEFVQDTRRSETEIDSMATMLHEWEDDEENADELYEPKSLNTMFSGGPWTSIPNTARYQKFAGAILHRNGYQNKKTTKTRLWFKIHPF